ncbi:MAG: phospho-N-acetylmuramoyl-pentapeptide-transferase [Planctomycetaceae bacterium]|nr:phospho-N-acetylmuramoyl-pentapeptide-transferase [Planctomycetaceae bacterium]
MFYWFIKEYGALLEHLELHSSGDSRVFLTARIALASLTSFALALGFGPVAIRWLKERYQERIDSASERLNELHASKSSTPTMGGLFIVLSIVVATLLWGNLSNSLVLLALFVVLSFSMLGAVDDWIKLRTKQNGLRVRQKFVGQIVLSLVMSLGLYFIHRESHETLGIVWPIKNYVIPLGVGYVCWSIVVCVSTSNAVNLTDGLDGLAGGCLVFSGLTFVGLSYVAGHAVIADYVSIPFVPECGELAVVLGAMVGAMLGFLWFNCYPAQVFMGDTGSLSIGALLALGALASRQEILLLICGGMFVVEALSVILQVGWFRMTRKRLIACSPLHNHYLFKGQHEMKIVVRFWIGSALLSIMAIASLKIR